MIVTIFYASSSSTPSSHVCLSQPPPQLPLPLLSILIRSKKAGLMDGARICEWQKWISICCWQSTNCCSLFMVASFGILTELRHGEPRASHLPQIEQCLQQELAHTMCGGEKLPAAAELVRRQEGSRSRNVDGRTRRQRAVTNKGKTTNDWDGGRLGLVQQWEGPEGDRPAARLARFHRRRIAAQDRWELMRAWLCGLRTVARTRNGLEARPQIP
ncbi:hypothetical protein BRADI_1g40754v3 [Brachypodium distachyon]|uniref:Uncharacterized protein n=1 Tax=Brachypodium distachyon TaxID=15368 RepID=A0A2K2DNP8_BRADI|nr:hypothetical protein BRADI_1g40754v3 [Brachypodium distachyon]